MTETAIIDKYKELIALSQTHIFEEYACGKKILSDSETHRFFQQYAIHKNKEAASLKHTCEPPLVQQKSPLPAAPPPQPRCPSEQAVPMHPNISRHAPPPPTVQIPETQALLPPEQKSIPQSPQREPPQPKPLPKEEKAVVENSIAKGKDRDFILEPLGAAPLPDFTEARKAILEAHPNFCIIEQIPDDSHAKRSRDKEKNKGIVPDIAILYFNSDVKQRTFLTNLANAITLSGTPAGVYSAHRIDSEGLWDKLLNQSSVRLIISSDNDLYTMEKLMTFYQEGDHERPRFLGKVPLFLLSDIALYLKQPNLKAALWRALTPMITP